MSLKQSSRLILFIIIFFLFMIATPSNAFASSHITQINLSFFQTFIHLFTNTGGNNIFGNTGGNTNIFTGNATNSVTVITQGGANINSGVSTVPEFNTLTGLLAILLSGGLTLLIRRKSLHASVFLD